MVELRLLAPEPLVEPVSDALIDELGALSVSVEDADADSAAEQALFGEPGLPAPAAGWQRSTLKALFDHEAQAEAAATRLLSQAWATDLHVQGLAEVADQDWVRLTQQQFEPVRITDNFWIVPSWHQPPAGVALALRLDPGLAFGTGTHPTTRMCLRWLATHPELLRGARVLDYGCGSGILAIGAAMLGAAAIDAVDIDPAAVAATRRNAADNAVGLRIVGLPEAVGAAAGRYDIVVANILATPLKLLAPLLCAHVAAGGRLLLAGILERQTAELQAAYASSLPLAVLDHEDGWALMGAARTA
jgi:ribosomal protein L11 methyltransferase